MSLKPEPESKYVRLSTGRMIGISLGPMIGTLMWSVVGMFQLYAEKALLIPTGVVLAIVGIYALWDAFNDPFTGFILDRSKKFTSKYGKRFPFILIGFIGAVVTLALIFFPVSNSQIILVVWILVFLIIWDQFQTFQELSTFGLTADLFRTKKERVRYGGVASIMEAIGSMLRGIAIPLTISIFGGESSPTAFFMMAVTLCGLLAVLAIPHLLSVREPKEMIEFRTELDTEGKHTSKFSNIMRRAFSDRNMVGFIIVYVAWAVYITCITIGIYYYVVDGLGLDVGLVTFFNLGFLAINVVSIPIWMYLAKKLGAKNGYTLALLSAVAISPFFFFLGWDFVSALIIGTIAGFTNAGLGVLFNSLYSEVIDNATVKSGKREESSYLGVFRFFSATAIFWQILIFLVVQTFTGYDPTIDYVTVAPELARIGLNAQISIIPASITLITTLIFMKLYTITKDKAIENKHKLKEMNL